MLPHLRIQKVKSVGYLSPHFPSLLTWIYSTTKKHKQTIINLYIILGSSSPSIRRLLICPAGFFATILGRLQYLLYINTNFKQRNIVCLECCEQKKLQKIVAVGIQSAVADPVTTQLDPIQLDPVQ